MMTTTRQCYLVTCLFFIFQCFRGVFGYIPPHADLLQENEQFHSEHKQWQRHLNANHHLYDNLQLLHPNVCQYVDDFQECIQADQFMRQQAQSVRSLISSKGQLRSLVLLMQFPNHANRPLPSVENVRKMLTGKGTDPILYPTGSLLDYVKMNSLNQLNLQIDVMDWTMTDNTESYYAFNRSGLIKDYMDSFTTILDQLDNDKKLNWDDYDRDGDGYIDSLIVLHSGFGAERNGVNDCGDDDNVKNKIWSHAIGWIREIPWQSKNGRVKVGTYMTASAMHGRCTSEVARLGIVAHELMHTWGLPDMYDSTWLGKGSGAYDVMSNPYGLDFSSYRPGFLGAWTREFMEWVKPTVLTRNGKYTLETLQTSGQVYRIDQGFPEGEYLLIENRQPILWDSLMWNGGIVIWHIDLKARRQKTRGYPGQEGWPGNANHYRMEIVQADKAFHLERGENRGGEDDFFVKGKELNPGPGVEIAVNADLYPNTDAHQGGNITITGIRIFDFSESQDVMTFQITGLAPALPTLPPSPAPTPVPSPQPTFPKPTPLPTKFPTLAPSFPPTVVVPTGSPTMKPTPRPTTTVMPSLRPTTTFAPTVTPVPTTGPTVSMEPTVTAQPTNEDGIAGAVKDAPSGKVNAGLAVGLTFLFTALAAGVAYWIWRTYYRKPTKSDLVHHTRVVDPGCDGSAGVELAMDNDDDSENDKTERYGVTALCAETGQPVALVKQTSIATTETGSSDNNSNSGGDNENAANGWDFQLLGNLFGGIFNNDKSSKDNTASDTPTTQEASQEEATNKSHHSQQDWDEEPAAPSTSPLNVSADGSITEAAASVFDLFASFSMDNGETDDASPTPPDKDWATDEPSQDVASSTNAVPSCPITQFRNSQADLATPSKLSSLDKHFYYMDLALQRPSSTKSTELMGPLSFDTNDECDSRFQHLQRQDSTDSEVTSRSAPSSCSFY